MSPDGSAIWGGQNTWHATGGAAGGYWEFPFAADAAWGSPITPTANSTRSRTIEFMLRLHPGSLDGPNNVVLWAPPNELSDVIILDATNSVIEVFSSSIDTLPDGSGAQAGQLSAEFALDVAGGGLSWASVADGAFHHYAATLDLIVNVMAFFIDGKLQPGWSRPVSAAPAGYIHRGMPAIDFVQFSEVYGTRSCSAISTRWHFATPRSRERCSPSTPRKPPPGSTTPLSTAAPRSLRSSPLRTPRRSSPTSRRPAPAFRRNRGW